MMTLKLTWNSEFCDIFSNSFIDRALARLHICFFCFQYHKCNGRFTYPRIQQPSVESESERSKSIKMDGIGWLNLRNKVMPSRPPNLRPQNNLNRSLYGPYSMV